MKIIADLFKKMNNKRKIFLQTISYCTFACFLINTSISNAEVEGEHDSIIAGTTTTQFYTSNTEEEILPSGMIRIFVDKNHMKSIVVVKQYCYIMLSETYTYCFGFKIG